MKLKTKQEIIEYRKFLYADEYPDGDYPNNILYPDPLTDKELDMYIDLGNTNGFKYFSYCPNCYDSWFGASGLDIKEHKLNKCPICEYERVQVYDCSTRVHINKDW